MKILFLSNIGLPPTFPFEDYQNDMLFHGLRSLFGEDCVDVARNKSMYKGYPQNPDKPMYGKGFTLYGTLDDIAVDRDDIETKIKTHYFDYIVYGQSTRSFPYHTIVMDNYPKSRIIIVDGEDDPSIRSSLRDNGIYFKRELQTTHNTVFPIQFCIPKEKLIHTQPIKRQDLAGTPTNQHIFNTEQDYYEEYQHSYFGVTHKKGGWDCLRHYEILMNRCIPYFRDIYFIPKQTMVFFPKELVIDGMQLINQDPIPSDKYWEIENQIFQITKNRLTTEAVAKYVIDKVRFG